MKHLFWATICIVAMFALLPSANQASAVTPDINGTDWTLKGSVTANAKTIGKIKDKGDFTLGFGPNPQTDLDPDNWLLIDPTGADLTGTFQENPDLPGRGIFLLEPNSTTLQDYIETKLLAAADDDDNVVISDIDITATTAFARAKETKKGITLALVIKAWVLVDAKVNDAPKQTRTATITIKARGLLPVTAAPSQAEGSSWLVAMDSLFTLKTVGKIRDDSTFEMIIGPNTDYNLANNEWMAVSDDDGDDFILAGTFTRKKNKLTIHGLNEHLAQLIWEYTEEALLNDGIYDFEITGLNITRQTATAIIQPGRSIRLNINVKYTGTAKIENEFETGRGSYIEKGFGTPYTKQ